MPEIHKINPTLFLAAENGWSWVYSEKGETLQSSEDLKTQVQGITFDAAAVAILGHAAPDGSSGHQRVVGSRGDVGYFLYEGDTRIFLLEPVAKRSESEELALSAAHELANALSAISGWAQLEN